MTEHLGLGTKWLKVATHSPGVPLMANVIVNMADKVQIRVFSIQLATLSSHAMLDQ